MHPATRVILAVAVIFSFSGGTAFGDDYASEGFYPNDGVGYFNLDLGYRGAAVPGITQGGHGFFLEFGLNLAKYFEPNTIVSPYCGINLVSGGAWNREFHDDFNRYYRKPPAMVALEGRYEDPATGNTALNEEEERELRAYRGGESRLALLRGGNPENTFDFFYGVMLRYPSRYAPVVKLYSLYSGPNMGSSSGDFSVYSGGSYQGTYQGANVLDRFGWGVEMILFPGYTWKGSPDGNLNLGYVSLFYETIDMSQTLAYSKNDIQHIRNVYMREYVDDAFMAKWGKEYKFGVKIGFHLL